VIQNDFLSGNARGFKNEIGTILSLSCGCAINQAKLSGFYPQF
jgi:hypothetical protein